MALGHETPQKVESFLNLDFREEEVFATLWIKWLFTKEIDVIVCMEHWSGQDRSRGTIVPMNTPQDSSLGREVSYPSQYDPGLLFPIPRSGARAEIGLDDAALPFVGHDRWHAFELSWLETRGKPQVAVATVQVPCTSPRLIESKSFKLYLNSLNSTRVDSAEALRERLVSDLSACAGAPVQVAFGLPGLRETPLGESIDGLDVEIDCYGPPQADFLAAAAGEVVEEPLVSSRLKSNCRVPGQPDWATVSLR